MKEYKIVATKKASTKLAKRMKEAFGLFCDVESEVLKKLDGDRVQMVVRLTPFVKNGLSTKLQNQAIGFLKGYRYGHDEGLFDKLIGDKTNPVVEEVGASESSKTKLAVPKNTKDDKGKKNNLDFLFPDKHKKGRVKK